MPKRKNKSYIPEFKTIKDLEFVLYQHKDGTMIALGRIAEMDMFVENDIAGNKVPKTKIIFYGHPRKDPIATPILKPEKSVKAKKIKKGKKCQ